MTYEDKSLRLYCTKCKLELIEPGALLFSPPAPWSSTVEKHHICKPCWALMVEWVTAK